jgi:hypothetical protein
MKICTEADYLQAYLTGIAGGSRRWNAAFLNLNLRITSILKTWIAAATASQEGGSGNFTNHGMNSHASGVLKFEKRFGLS